MKLPIDVNDLVKSGGRIREQREQELRIAVFVESDAPDELVECVRERLVPETANARLHVDVVSRGEALTVDMMADAVVALVGSGAFVPPSLAMVRERGVPCVALVMSSEREYWARVLQHPVRDVLGDADLTHLVEKDLAHWLADRLESKKLALASNFAFMRRAVAHDAVNVTSFQNAAIGAAPFLPGTDMPIMTANQMKMVLQIAAAYGEPLSAERIRELAVVLGGGFVFRAIARTALGFIPILGWAVRGGIGYTGTLAMGAAAIEYFEAGGSPAELAEKLRETVDHLRGLDEPEPLPATATVVEPPAASDAAAAAPAAPQPSLPVAPEAEAL